MKKVLMFLTLFVFALTTSSFAMSVKPRDLNVTPDTLIDGDEAGTFNGSTVSINSDYISSLTAYNQGSTTKIQIYLGTSFADNISYCLQLPSSEVGRVGRVAFNKLNDQFKQWVNPNTDPLGAPLKVEGKDIRLNPKNIESVRGWRGFLADANKNGCNNPYGDYPNWQFNIILTMSTAEYDQIKNQLNGF